MAEDKGHEETILIVDDSEDNRNLLSLMLREDGYDIVEAVNGEDALAKVHENPPDLILLDVMMPGMDGYEVCERLKRDELLKEIPVIFLSGLGKVKDKIRGLEIGGADYVAKPFHMGETLARIRTHLKIRRLTKDVLIANRALLDKQERLDEDLRAAGGIQRSLLPKRLPESTQLEMAWKFIPSETIGGDIFNVFSLDGRHYAFYMLDVSGHGVPSALVTVSVSQILQPHSEGILMQQIAEPPYYKLLSPREVLERLDREYPIERFEKYFTVFYGIIHMDSEELVYSSAGHPPAILLRESGQTELLDEGGPIIGLGSSIPFDMGQKKLIRGDKMILYTDGVLECQNERGEFYGSERFLRVLKQSRDQNLDVILDKVIEDIKSFCVDVKPQDDITLLGMAYRGKVPESLM